MTLPWDFKTSTKQFHPGSIDEIEDCCSSVLAFMKTSDESQGSRLGDQERKDNNNGHRATTYRTRWETRHDVRIQLAFSTESAKKNIISAKTDKNYFELIMY